MSSLCGSIAQQGLRAHGAPLSSGVTGSVLITHKMKCQSESAKMQFYAIKAAHHRYAAALHHRAWCQWCSLISETVRQQIVHGLALHVKSLAQSCSFRPRSSKSLVCEDNCTKGLEVTRSTFVLRTDRSVVITCKLACQSESAKMQFHAM